MCHLGMHCVPKRIQCKIKNRIDHNHKIINCKIWFAKINGSDKLVQTSLSAFDGITACNNDIELIKHPEDCFFFVKSADEIEIEIENG